MISVCSCIYVCMLHTLTLVEAYNFDISRVPDTPTKRSNAQHLVEYKKQLLYEENRKSGNVMQQPMDYCVCGINTSS